MDVDIDLKTSFDPLDYFPTAIKASRVQDGVLKPHPAGAYFQNIPKDKITGFAAIPFREAEDEGYFKIDFLHLSLLDNFESKEEIRILLKKEPEWAMLHDPKVVEQLFQIHKHYNLVTQVNPQSVQDLADCIALIRPAKRYLLNYYLKDRIATRKALYQKPDDGRPYFKKPHAISYALTIVLQLHLINAGVL